MTERQPKRQPQEQPGQKPPRKGIARILDARISKRKAIIAGSILTAGAVAGLTTEAVILSQDSHSDKANTTDAGDSANPTPPSLTTPDGKTVVVPGVGGSSATSEASKSATAVTTEQLQPTATPTKETVAEVPCQIVPEQYCAGAERILFTDQNQGKDFTYIGLKIPAGTRLTAPRAGELQKTGAGDQPFHGNLGIIRAADNRSGVIIIGGIQFDNKINQQVTPGTSFGTIASESTVNLGGYDLIITINNAGPNGPISDLEGLKQLFPQAFEKPVSNHVTQTTPVQTGTTFVYFN